MSKKMKRFFDKPQKKIEKSEVIEIDVSKYLIEATKIVNDDMSTIISYINNPKFGSFVLKSYAGKYTEDEREVDVHIMNGRRTITFEYNKDFDELTNEFIDYCDANNLTFKTSYERPTNTTYFAVYK